MYQVNILTYPDIKYLPMHFDADPLTLKLSDQMIDTFLFDCSSIINFETVLEMNQNIRCSIGKHDLNRRNKLILEIELSKGVPVSFSPTRLIIFFLHADWLER